MWKNDSSLMLYGRLILPVLIVFVGFALFVKVIWTPQILDEVRQKVIEVEIELLENLSPAVERDLLAGDLAALYMTLRKLENTKSIRGDDNGGRTLARRIKLFNQDGLRIYPLPDSSLPVVKDLYTVTLPMVHNGENLGRIESSFDMKRAISPATQKANELQVLALLIAAGVSAFLVFVYYTTIGRPMMQLAKAARRMGEGDFTLQLPMSAVKLTGTFGEAFSNMQQALEDSQKHLQAKVTEASEHASRYRVVLESVPGALLVLDESGVIEDLNGGTEELFGYERSELAGRSCLELFEGMDCQQKMKDSFLALGEITLDAENIAACKDGSRLPVQITRRAMEVGGALKLILMVVDITQQQIDHEALLSVLEQAQTAARAKSDFLSRMSHELRTPLNAISGFSQLLLECTRAEDEDQRHYIAEINQASDVLIQLINEILDLEQINLGKIELNIEPLNIQAIISGVYRKMNAHAFLQGVSLEQPVIDLEYSVIGDERRVRQVLMNLVSNAIKYNRSGGSVTLEVTQSQAGDGCRISVTDTGRGIDKADLTKLFKPFGRLESPYEGVSGAGIGLAISKRLCEEMNGRIDVSSEIDRGSTFWVELPIDQQTSQNAEGSNIDASGAVRILCIEDNPANMKLMAKLIKKRTGITVSETMMAEEGLMIARKEHPALIFMDINLPGMDGYESLKQLKSSPQTCNIPVVAITASATTPEIKRLKGAAFDDFLIKPIKVEKLDELLWRYLPADDPACSRA